MIIELHFIWWEIVERALQSEEAVYVHVQYGQSKELRLQQGKQREVVGGLKTYFTNASMLTLTNMNSTSFFPKSSFFHFLFYASHAWAALCSFFSLTSDKLTGLIISASFYLWNTFSLFSVSYFTWVIKILLGHSACSPLTYPSHFPNDLSQK